MIIRKISIGNDYKNAMHYSVNNSALGNYKISEIVRKPNGEINIYITSDFETVLWKTVNNTYPVIVEYDINGY